MNLSVNLTAATDSISRGCY